MIVIVDRETNEKRLTKPEDFREINTGTWQLKFWNGERERCLIFYGDTQCKLCGIPIRNQSNVQLCYFCLSQINNWILGNPVMYVYRKRFKKLGIKRIREISMNIINEMEERKHSDGCF